VYKELKPTLVAFLSSVGDPKGCCLSLHPLNVAERNTTSIPNPCWFLVLSYVVRKLSAFAPCTGSADQWW
jgi:hypothetical protein